MLVTSSQLVAKPAKAFQRLTHRVALLTDPRLKPVTTISDSQIRRRLRRSSANCESPNCQLRSREFRMADSKSIVSGGIPRYAMRHCLRQAQPFPRAAYSGFSPSFIRPAEAAYKAEKGTGQSGAARGLAPAGLQI